MVGIALSAVGCLSSVNFLKFLKESGFKVIGTDITDLSIGKFFVDSFYKVPKAIDTNKVVKRYKDIVRKEGIDYIISGPEEEILILMRHQNSFKDLGTVVLHSPLETLEIIVDKFNTVEFFSKKGIKMPESYLLKDLNICSKREKVIIKPRRGRGSSGTFICERNNRHLLRKTFKDCENGYIAQHFIEGEEFTVDALYDMEGNVLNIVPRKRLKVDSGISVIAETVKDRNLFDIVSKISSYLKFIGGNCFQFIKDKDKNYYLTDINPRFGGGFVFSLKVSKSLRGNLINLLKGKRDLLKKSSFEFEKARLFRYYDEIFGV